MWNEPIYLDCLLHKRCSRFCAESGSRLFSAARQHATFCYSVSMWQRKLPTHFFLSINTMDSLLHIAARIEATIASYVSVPHVGDRAEWERYFEAEKVHI